MFGAYVRENRKLVIALAVYTVVFALVLWLYAVAEAEQITEAFIG